jgi:DAK2 domain fusion protein YloV
MDGQVFKQLTKAALGWLQHHQAVINALNVYPVPDGDTGTNMVLTMQSAWAEIEGSPEQNVGRVVHQMAHGALMGARGNSGVILSQIWRGFARGLDEKEVCRSADLVAACQEAATTAYKGVVKPVEGTILTVTRAVADSAARAAGTADDLLRILEHMVFAAHEAVLLTPSLLPVLREAGVVDAGGQGLFVILEGMARYLHGEPIAEDVTLDRAVDLIGTRLDFGEGEYGYDVQFLIMGQALEVDEIRERINQMGECPLVVGDVNTVKVHVHVTDPGEPMSYAARLGSLRDVVIEDMQAQYQEFIAEQQLNTACPSNDAVVGIVVVVAGDGLKQVFQSLGASVVVEGGQTMNPSTKDLLEAIERAPCAQVVVLPNNSNIILAAEQASALSEKSVAVVPTATIPQGISALLALNLQADLETNVKMMMSAMGEVETGEVTTATRSATFDGIRVSEGQTIGLHNGTLKVADKTPEEVVQLLLREMQNEEAEIITLYYGDTVTQHEAAALADTIREQWPDQEVEVVAGGQAHYHYILSVE